VSVSASHGYLEQHPHKGLAVNLVLRGPCGQCFGFVRVEVECCGSHRPE